MKPFHSWSSAVTILTLALCAGVALAAPNVRVKRGDEVEVIADAESAVNPLASQASKQSAQAVKDAIHPTKAPVSVTTDDTPDFDRQKVSLQVPDELFGSSFTLVTNISGRIGDLIMHGTPGWRIFLGVPAPVRQAPHDRDPDDDDDDDDAAYDHDDPGRSHHHARYRPRARPAVQRNRHERHLKLGGHGFYSFLLHSLSYLLRKDEYDYGLFSFTTTKQKHTW
ncbi:uncharacterized protein LOC4575960 isoform X2 [Anopheles gambiae]|uniref:uncharacterized protein LOC4575960 isoform X2 n=1 Tax=Anopheles gambiae TaxID=7165 RepID=UPI002AC94E74|nr:uncharacterized protein LOC4575960 isoform X2 [Anopheles gambiae]